MGTSGLAAAILNLKGNPMLYSLDIVFLEVLSPQDPHLGVGSFQTSCLDAEICVLPV